MIYKVQAGLEGTPGNPVDATAKWMAYQLYPQVSHKKWEQREEDRGSKFGAFRHEAPSQEAAMGDLVGPATFEDIPFPLGMAIKGGIGPSQPNSATAPDTYLWDYDPTPDAADVPDTYSVEWGDLNLIRESEYVFATDLTIEGSVNGAWRISAPLVGRKHTDGGFTPGKSDRVVEDVLFNLSKLYMEDTGGNIGDTPIEGAFRSFSWRMGEHFVPFPTGDGTLFFTRHSEKKYALGFPELTIGMVVDAATKEKMTTKCDAGTIQLVRIAGIGTTINDPYTKYVYIDGAYLIKVVSPLADADGQSLVKLTLAGEYDKDWGKLFRIQVQNTIDVLP